MKFIICATLFLPLLANIGCRDNDQLQEATNNIIGEWVQIHPECTDNTCDTVKFFESGTFSSDLYYLNDPSFKIVKKDTILIDNYRHYFYFSDDNQNLFIEDFIIPDIGLERKSIELIKI